MPGEHVLFGPFQNDLNVGFRHLLPQIPMNQETAAAVQDAAQIVERRTNVQVGNIDIQCWCGSGGCSNPVPFFEGFPFHFRSSPARLKTHATRSRGRGTGLLSSSDSA
jgi:hypothetical protein